MVPEHRGRTRAEAQALPPQPGVAVMPRLGFRSQGFPFGGIPASGQSIGNAGDGEGPFPGAMQFEIPAVEDPERSVEIYLEQTPHGGDGLVIRTDAPAQDDQRGGGPCKKDGGMKRRPLETGHDLGLGEKAQLLRYRQALGPDDAPAALRQHVLQDFLAPASPFRGDAGP